MNKNIRLGALASLALALMVEDLKMPDSTSPEANHHVAISEDESGIEVVIFEVPNALAS